MTKEVITKTGIITEAQTSGLFRVEFDEGDIALTVLSGRMRKFRIRVMPGDRVKVEFSPHDLTRGRIVTRL